MTIEMTPETGPAERQATWALRLFVAGQSRKSLRAIENLERICERELFGDFFIETVDILAQPELAKDDEIIATPTLVVRKLHEPTRRIIGDLSDTDEVLTGLQIIPRRR